MSHFSEYYDKCATISEIYMKFLSRFVEISLVPTDTAVPVVRQVKQHLAKKKLTLAVIGAIVGIAYGMNYANTFHEFTAWTMSLLPDEMSRMIYRLILDFLMQPVTIANYSFPLGLALLGSAIIGSIAMSMMRPRRRDKWEFR